jgi:hypothetical protein
MQNIVDSQVSDIDQSINNYGNMTDVIQDADVYQSMTPEPEHNDEQHSQTSFVPSNNLPELNSVEVVDDQYAQFNIQ